MKPEERISYLIDLLEGGSAIKFAQRAGIPPACLSRARNGRGNAAFYFPRILEAYPEIKTEWLYSGKGAPTYNRHNKSLVDAKIVRIEKDLEELRKMVNKLEKSFSKVSQPE